MLLKNIPIIESQEQKAKKFSNYVKGEAIKRNIKCALLIYSNGELIASGNKQVLQWLGNAMKDYKKDVPQLAVDKKIII